MVRTTTAADDATPTNDITRFHRATTTARRELQTDFDDVSTSFTATSRLYGDDDFDDDGDYVGDDPVYVVAEVTRRVPIERSDKTAMAMVDGVISHDFAVVDVDRTDYFRANRDPSKSIAQPAAVKDADFTRITVVARRRIN